MIWHRYSLVALVLWCRLTENEVTVTLSVTCVGFFLRCVFPVVLSNNNNKLLVHTYIVKNTTIFLIVRLLLIRYNYMFRPSSGCT